MHYTQKADSLSRIIHENDRFSMLEPLLHYFEESYRCIGAQVVCNSELDCEEFLLDMYADVPFLSDSDTE